MVTRLVRRQCEEFNFRSSSRMAEYLMHDDNADDDFQWPTARLRPARRSYGCGDCKDLYQTLDKENKAKVSASSTILRTSRQYLNQIRKHVGPFSGPLDPITEQSFCGKPSRVPSIIPTNIHRRKELGFNACEPMSPEVTCLGRIKSKEFNSKCGWKQMNADGPVVDSQMVQKGKCSDIENRLCGKRRKGRKKKKEEEKVKKSFASRDAKSLPSELVLTRREKTATLASSLSDMLVDPRRVERERAHYEPSVPPPNSLLLMRGCRIGDKDMDMGNGTMDIMGHQVDAVMPPPNSLLLMRRCRIRRNLSLLMDQRVKHIQGCSTSVNDDARHVEKLKTRAAHHFSLRELIDEENTIADGASTFKVRDHTSTTQGSDALDTRNLSASTDIIKMASKLTKEKVLQDCRSRATLCQRRAFGELSYIEVNQRTKMER